MTQRLMAGATIVCACLIGSNAAAQRLAATEERHGFGFGYGDTRWDNFSAELDARFDEVVIIPDLNDLDLMLEYDALMVQLREWGARLGATESANLAAYVKTGRRVLLIGENSLWTDWNNTMLAVVGGSYSGVEADGVMTVANPYPPLTDNVTSIDLPDGGTAVGGLSIFNENFATIWSGDGSENVFSMLDVNVFEDDRWNTLDGAVYATNVTEWLSSGPSGGPSIEVSGSCPGQVTVTVSDATPDGNVALIFARGTGGVVIPPGSPCAGTQLGLNSSAQLVQTARANSSGVATFSAQAPAAACGGFVQALDVVTCATTTVAGI